MHHLARAAVLEARQYAEYGRELTPASVTEQYGIPPAELADLSLNVNVYGPSGGARLAVLQSLDRLHRYPDAHLTQLRACLGAAHGVGADSVLIGAGIDDLLKLIAQTFIDPGDQAVIPVPTFPRFELEVRLMGGQCELVPLTGAFRAARGGSTEPGDASHQADLSLLAQQSHRGRDYREAISLLSRQVEAGPLVVLDEALIFPGEAGALDLMQAHRNLLVLRTFSKYHGLAGARVGYLVGEPGVLALIDVVRPPELTSAAWARRRRWAPWPIRVSWPAAGLQWSGNGPICWRPSMPCRACGPCLRARPFYCWMCMPQA